MSQLPRIMRDDRQFHESYFRLAVPGFEQDMEITVQVDWYDGWHKRNDPHAGKYPWVEVRWPSSSSAPDRRKLAGFSYVLHQAALIEQYVASGLIRAPLVDLIPYGETKVGQVIEWWQVVANNDQHVPVPVIGLERVEFEVGAAFVNKTNADGNAGLHMLGGQTSFEHAMTLRSSKRS